MKKPFPVLMILSILGLVLVTNASAASVVMLTPTAELGQLKVCKVAGTGVEVGTIFNFHVNNSIYSVPAGPGDRNGYCVLAGQYPVNSEVTIEEDIPDGYYVSRIEVKPDHIVHKDVHRGIVTIRMVSGVMEAIFTNKKDTGTPTPTRTPTSINTSTPKPTKTPPSCDPNCTPTFTPVPKGRLQICKEAEGPGVIGSFTFRFENRSRTVPVGACAGLISVNAGMLTITEDSQAGYEVAGIYTIPADRLIDKNLDTGVATVRMVEGTAASQTIVIFRNRSMGMACVSVDFTNVRVEESVEGLGKVHPDLNIDAKGTAKRVDALQLPLSYQSPNVLQGINNGWLAADGGFSDVSTQIALEPHFYTFTFDIPITDFSLHMLDFGDENPNLSTHHKAIMIAYDANNNVVSQQELSYTTEPVAFPGVAKKLDGTIWCEDLGLCGDAFARLGEPGNWIWNVGTNVPGNGIVKVDLRFGYEVSGDMNNGYDPHIAFDLISFTQDCADCKPISVNFSAIQAGESVEGLGRVHRDLNINAKGTALHVVEENNPVIYQSPNGLQGIVGIVNGGLVADGGFSDVSTQIAREPHLYTFTFAPGVSVSNFSLHMLDFGDWNPTLSTDHVASMTAYDANGLEIPNAKQVLSYTSDAEAVPRSSEYGDLFITGDAITANPGQPGNWTWNIAGNGIVKLVLEFGAGYDPSIAFDFLSFTTECAAGCPPEFVSADFSSIQIGQSVEGLGSVAPYLSIDAKGTALHVVQDGIPAVYQSPNGQSQINGGLDAGGGFSDLDAKDEQGKRLPHLYTFTFAPGVSITNFSLHMLDFGDWNYNLQVSHKAIMTAYDAVDGGNVVFQQELRYTTLPVPGPRWSDLYGNLRASGDALSARPGEPGNWIWNVTGKGIVKVDLRFGYEVGDRDDAGNLIEYGFDPNIAFDLLSFCPE